MEEQFSVEEILIMAETDPKKAAQLMEQEANNGNQAAQFQIGKFYYNGFGVEKDSEKGIKWLMKSAENSYLDAVYLESILITIRDHMESVKKDDVKAQEIVAEKYYEIGDLLELAHDSVEYKKAVKCAQGAIDNGSAYAYYLKGQAYQEGKGVERNMAEAEASFKKGIDLGDPACKYAYASLILAEMVENPDFEYAFRLSKEACESGYSKAYKLLGLCCRYGFGTEINTLKAVEYYNLFLQDYYQKEVESALEELLK